MFSGLVDRGNLPALVNTLSFNEARLRVIADNVANIHTPGFRAKQLNPAAFQEALGKAMLERGNDPRKPLLIRSADAMTESSGRLAVTPREKPVDNVLFHDGTNASIEREMADLAETGMMHDMASRLLRMQFDGLRKAIRGTV